MDLKKYIANVPDFPMEGILFRDITPLLADGEAFKETINQLSNFAKSLNADVICGPESRGFIFGCPVAADMNIGFVPIRKPNKLPREQVTASYDLEYGSNVLCMHKDAIKPGQRVVIVDDLLATGGTMKAAIQLIESLGGIVAGVAFVIELEELEGKKNFEGYNLFTILKY